jgi:DNA-binding Lrp family transcriptional regulator
MMDLIDKKILVTLFKDGRISQRKLAEMLNLSATSLNYRFNKLLNDGIIKGFTLSVNPNLYNKYYATVSFKNYKDVDYDFITVKVKCLEEVNVYTITGNSINDLKDKIDLMSKELGEPNMVYLPISQTPFKPSGVDIEIVKALAKNPRAETAEISKETGLPTKTIQRRINALESKNLVRVLPLIDLYKADIVVFGIFSEIISKMNFLDSCKFLGFKEGDKGVVLCATESMGNAEKHLKFAREIDQNSQIMITVDYSIRTDIALKNLEDIENKAIIRSK